MYRAARERGFFFPERKFIGALANAEKFQLKAGLHGNRLPRET